jgi:multidrug resistance efflux pump
VRIVLEDYAAELGKLRPGLSVIVRVDTRQSTGVPLDERQGPPGHDDEPQGTPVRDARR